MCLPRYSRERKMQALLLGLAAAVRSESSMC
jgi:hypothetical protein